MKIRNIELDDEQFPETVTVEMSLSEAIVITKLLGGFSPKDVEEKLPGYSGEHDDVWSALVGNVFNRFWDNGVDGALHGDDF